MQTLTDTYIRLLSNTSLAFKRYLYSQINWDNRLIIIRGAKGVGKTTMMLQRIVERYPDPEKAFYAPLDNIWFGSHTIVSLVEQLYPRGVEVLFLDEVHKYPNWRQEIKNIYDSYPKFKLVITGSSMLQLTSSAIGDLSRRARLYTLKGLSFREYLNFEFNTQLRAVDIDELLVRHTEISRSVAKDISAAADLNILKTFKDYQHHGYYPFYKEEGDGFADRLLRVVATIIEAEIPAVSGINYSSVYKIRQLLSILANQTPYSLNVASLSRELDTSRDNVLKLIRLMANAALTLNLYSADGFKSLAKPEKILFENTNIMHALSASTDNGTERETFFASQMQGLHKMVMPQSGDFLVDDKYLFEIGGKNKSFNQIKDLPQSYVVSADIDEGFGSRLPLWVFGMLY